MTSMHLTCFARRSLLLAGTAAVLAITTAELARAADRQEEAKSYTIASQPLADALRAYAATAGLQAFFAEDDVAGRRSPALSGTYTRQEALGRLLTGTGLIATMTDERTVVIKPGASSPLGEPGAGQGPAASAGAEADDREIVVTGTLIRGSAPSGANLIVLGREDLDNTGRGTLAEAIQTVPQVHGGGINDATMRTGVGAAPSAFGSSGWSGSASLNLRGVGVEETLTLVNGRRLAPTGGFGAVADISALPMAAVERVEILADGASATYGADAMAGVVNIIMNRHFEGAETRLRTGLETRSGQPSIQASQSFGWAFDRGNILLSADYARQDGVTAKGRPYAASADLRPFGGSDHRLNRCSPGNIIAPAGLAGAIPAGQDGTSLTPDQIQRGASRRCDLYPVSSHLTPESEKISLYLAGSYDVTDRLRLSTDVLAAKRRTTIVGAYRTASALTVPVSNAYRQMNGLHGDTMPLNQDIRVAYLFSEVDPSTDSNDMWSLLGSIGMDYRLSDVWQLSLTGSYGRYDVKGKILSLDVDSGGALQRALASSDPATAFNPFGDGSTNSRELVESFLYPYHGLQESDYRAASLSLNGALLDLPGGAMKLAVGGDYRRESFGRRYRYFYPRLAPGFEDVSPLDAKRNVAAAYAELFIPLFSERNAVTGARRLSVSLSGRYDHYSDFGSTYNPKAGVTWVPLNGLTLKGSYGTSFKAPLLTSLYEPSAVVHLPTAANAGAPDVNGDGFVSMLAVSGGNPDLGPEEGKSWTAGVEIEPAALPGLRLYATYFNLHFSGRFGQALPSPVLADPAAFLDIVYFPLPSQLQVNSWIASADQVYGVLPPADSIEAIIDRRTRNFASQVIDGVDAGASYRWKALGGIFNLTGDISYLSRYKSRLGQSVTMTSYVGNVGLPARWKARGGLAWAGHGASLSGSVNHTASYTNKLVQPHEPVSAYTTVDLSAQVQLGGWVRGIVGDGAALSFYVTNLFDRAPPFVNNPLGSSGLGYDGANADPIGRRVAVQLTKRW